MKKWFDPLCICMYGPDAYVYVFLYLATVFLRLCFLTLLLTMYD